VLKNDTNKTDDQELKKVKEQVNKI